MAINNDFYKAINALVAQGTDGTTSVVDYASFIDYGKAASDLSVSNDLQNAYMSNLLNRIKMVIQDNPLYVGDYMDLVVTGGDPGEIIQTVMSTFYEATYNRALTALENGQSYTDQFEVNKIKGKTLYHMNTNGCEVAITIEDVRWKAAWMTPEALDRFNREQLNAVLNTISLESESARMAQVADVINKALGETANVTDETKGAINYDLLAIYNTKFETALTTANCLHNDAFVRWSASVIRDISYMMTKVSTKFNLHGADLNDNWKTFTPKDYQRLKINSLYERAVAVSTFDTYHREDAGLPAIATEAIPYWQNQDKRLQVEAGPANAEDTTPNYGDPVIAVLFDKRRVMQQIQMDDVQNERNSRRRYTNYFFQSAFLAYSNEYANAVVFTIAGASA